MVSGFSDVSPQTSGSKFDDNRQDYIGRERSLWTEAEGKGLQGLQNGLHILAEE